MSTPFWKWWTDAGYPPPLGDDLDQACTDRFRLIIQKSKELAAQHYDAEIRPELLLVALLDSNGVGALVVKELGAAGVGIEVRESLVTYVADRSPQPAPRFSAAAQRAIGRAAIEARDTHEQLKLVFPSYVYAGSEHLLLGLLHAPSGVLAEALR